MAGIVFAKAKTSEPKNCFACLAFPHIFEKRKKISNSSGGWSSFAVKVSTKHPPAVYHMQSA
jgi:hypothetical protein